MSIVPGKYLELLQKSFDCFHHSFSKAVTLRVPGTTSDVLIGIHSDEQTQPFVELHTGVHCSSIELPLYHVRRRLLDEVAIAKKAIPLVHAVHCLRGTRGRLVCSDRTSVVCSRPFVA